MNISSLNKSISEMGHEEALALVLKIRASRITYKKKPKKEKTIDLSSMVKNLTPEEAESLRLLLEGDEG
jgi:hypothetical protein